MIDGRRADSARRRERVAAAIDTARHAQGDLSVSSIARAAGVDRSFLYRHHDLLAQIHNAQTSRRAHCPTNSSQVSAASLTAELANAHSPIARQSAHSRQLERRLSELLGDHAWHQAGLGAPADVDELQRRITHLEQRIIDLEGQLDERDQELAAARAANRELMTDLNRRHD